MFASVTRILHPCIRATLTGSGSRPACLAQVVERSGWTVNGSTNTGLVRGGTPARLDPMSESNLGRELESEELDDCLRDPDGSRIVPVRGERGVGRSAFVRAAADRPRAEGVACMPLSCVPGDGEHPLLLALRIVTALEMPRSTMARRRPVGTPALDALSAAERGDRAAMAEALTATLAQSAPAAVVVDDAQRADAESLASAQRGCLRADPARHPDDSHSGPARCDRRGSPSPTPSAASSTKGSWTNCTAKTAQHLEAGRSAYRCWPIPS